MSDGQVQFRKFIERVKKCGPRALLPEIALIGSQQAQAYRSDAGNSWISPFAPWALTAIARESVVHAIDNGKPADGALVGQLCSMYLDLDDPLLHGDPLDSFLVRASFEQFRWTISEFEELSRARALMIEAASLTPDVPTFDKASWQSALGCSLEDFIETGFAFYAWATENRGWVDLSLLNSPSMAPLVEQYPEPLLRGVLDGLLSASTSELRSMDRAAQAGLQIPDTVKEHRFNPLTARPLLRWHDGKYLAPHPLKILHRLGCNGLYYDRVGEKGFTDQLGPVFETYVGLNLDLIQDAVIHREVDLGNSDGLSVDFIVELPDVIVLVEAKATRLTEGARLGLTGLSADVERTLGRAYEQIIRTHTLLVDGHSALAFLPSDRPVCGLAVTLEPYWMAAPHQVDFSLKNSPLQINATDISDLEGFCAAMQLRPAGEVLLNLPPGNPVKVLRGALDTQIPRNPILQRNWDAIFQRRNE